MEYLEPNSSREVEKINQTPQQILPPDKSGLLGSLSLYLSDIKLTRQHELV